MPLCAAPRVASLGRAVDPSATRCLRRCSGNLVGILRLSPPRLVRGLVLQRRPRRVASAVEGGPQSLRQRTMGIWINDAHLHPLLHAAWAAS